LEQRILEMASTDTLTGVLNRRAFMEKMEQEIHRSIREGRHFSLILASQRRRCCTSKVYRQAVGIFKTIRLCGQIWR
jgi:hypothetical protein